MPPTSKTEHPMNTNPLILTSTNTQPTQNLAPPSTPVVATNTTSTTNNNSPNSQMDQPQLAIPTPNALKHNQPWGDIWDAHHPKTHFHAVSKIPEQLILKIWICLQSQTH